MFMWLKTTCTCLDWQETYFHTFIRVLNIIVNATRKVKMREGWEQPQSYVPVALKVTGYKQHSTYSWVGATYIEPLY